MLSLGLYVAFIVYISILLAIGLFAHFSPTSSDFSLGGRTTNYYITAIAAHASDMSAWLFMGFPAAIYVHGLASSWIAVGLISGMFLSWHYVAYPLRLMTHQYDSYTIAEFLNTHFSDKKKYISFASSFILILFFLVYIAAGLTGLGHVFEEVFSIHYVTGITIGLNVSILYVLLGGFVAIAWTHFFQGLFLLCMIALVAIIGAHKLLSLNQPLDWISYFSNQSIDWLYITNGIAWGIGYIGMPHVIVNYMGIRDPKRIVHAKYIGMSWLILSLLSAIFVGIIGRGFFKTLPNPELLFILLVEQLFQPFFAGLILCAILAATMSTIDTQLLVAASSLSRDLLPKHLKKKFNYLPIHRIALILLAALSYTLSLFKSYTIMGLVSYAWSGLSSAFSPTILWALYGKKCDPRFVVCGMLLGACISGIWPILHSPVLALIPGCIANVLILAIGSFLTKN